jgi:hypothetical protein
MFSGHILEGAFFALCVSGAVAFTLLSALLATEFVDRIRAWRRRGWSRLACVSALLLLWPVSAGAQCPGFPARGVQIIDALYNPALAQGTDDQRRELTRTFLEQLVYESPADGWTWKSADPGRPPSKDSLARIVNGRLCNYDWQNGSTRGRQIQAGGPGDDITGQNPIAVAGVNHLSDASTVNVPPVNQGQSPVIITSQTDLSAVKAWIEQAQAAIDAAEERRYIDLVNRHNQTDAIVKEAADKQGALAATFSNRYVQIALAALGAWYTQKAVN